MTVLGHKLGLYKPWPCGTARFIGNRQTLRLRERTCASGSIARRRPVMLFIIPLVPRTSLPRSRRWYWLMTTARYSCRLRGKCQFRCFLTKRKPSRPFALAKASPGMSTMSAFFAASRHFTETATGIVWFASGCRRSAAWRKSCAPAPKSRMWLRSWSFHGPHGRGVPADALLGLRLS
jgi:hypothetical protein